MEWPLAFEQAIVDLQGLVSLPAEGVSVVPVPADLVVGPALVASEHIDAVVHQQLAALPLVAVVVVSVEVAAVGVVAALPRLEAAVSQLAPASQGPGEAPVPRLRPALPRGWRVVQHFPSFN